MLTAFGMNKKKFQHKLCHPIASLCLISKPLCYSCKHRGKICEFPLPHEIIHLRSLFFKKKKKIPYLTLAQMENCLSSMSTFLHKKKFPFFSTTHFWMRAEKKNHENVTYLTAVAKRFLCALIIRNTIDTMRIQSRSVKSTSLMTKHWESEKYFLDLTLSFWIICRQLLERCLLDSILVIVAICVWHESYSGCTGMRRFFGN